MSSTFNPSEHPRGDAGKFTQHAHAESPVDLPGTQQSVFGPDADEGDDILKNAPSQDGDGNHQPLEFTPYEGDFPRKEESDSVFGPDADEGDDILKNAPSQDGDGPENQEPFVLDEDDEDFPPRR
jgi:hypothetical protein